MNDEPERFHADVEPDPETLRWVRQRAAEFYAGDVGKCVSEILRATMEREQYYQTAGYEPGDEPVDPWAPLEAQIKPRTYRKGQAPQADGEGDLRAKIKALADGLRDGSISAPEPNGRDVASMLTLILVGTFDPRSNQ